MNASEHAAYIRGHSSPLTPVPTGETARLVALPEVRSVVFDIYGTLFISAAGDISLAEDTGRDDLLRRAIEIGTGQTLAGDGQGLAAAYLERIRVHQERRREDGIEFPEVEIRDIWRDLLHDLVAAAALPEATPTGPATCERVAVAYECAANPVWPMPGLAETLAALAGRNLALGIVSNAQFYTRHLFPAFLDGRDLDALGFESDLGVFSYRLREGKPSRRLYEVLAGHLAARHLSPDQVLYVGNDLRNDIWPARALGFRTALFAGDARSLRWREDDPRVAGVVPDLVITGLAQLVDLLS